MKILKYIWNLLNRLWQIIFPKNGHDDIIHPACSSSTHIPNQEMESEPPPFELGWAIGFIQVDYIFIGFLYRRLFVSFFDKMKSPYWGGGKTKTGMRDQCQINRVLDAIL